MAKLPTVFSLRHFLVLSLALNVSLILRLMLYQSEKGHNHSCFETERGTSISRTNSYTEGHNINIHKSRMLISSSTSSLANSTCADQTGGRNRVINLDHWKNTKVGGVTCRIRTLHGDPLSAMVITLYYE
ncbi:hypothetical protein CR513_04885, partial [Mucuna pruriens]